MGSGFIGFGVLGLWGLGVLGYGFWVMDFGFWVMGFGLGVLGV